MSNLFLDNFPSYSPGEIVTVDLPQFHGKLGVVHGVGVSNIQQTDQIDSNFYVYDVVFTDGTEAGRIFQYRLRAADRFTPSLTLNDLSIAGKQAGVVSYMNIVREVVVAQLNHRLGGPLLQATPIHQLNYAVAAGCTESMEKLLRDLSYLRDLKA